MPKYLSNWSAKRSGATITIEGTDETGQKATVAGIDRIEGKTGKGLLAHQKLKGSTPIKLEA